MEILDKLYFVGFIMLGILASLGIYLNYRYLLILKTTHYEKWKDLGSPEIITNNSLKNNIAVFNFLRKKESLALNDQTLTKISIACRILILFI